MRECVLPVSATSGALAATTWAGVLLASSRRVPARRGVFFPAAHSPMSPCYHRTTARSPPFEDRTARSAVTLPDRVRTGT
ncbi:hypothetical protein OH77DRAFT_1431344 [Trametes cingulata]|nr:hypothetical protein OH77DRAFT_1431344 [Trametes cingulata]